MTTIKTNKPQKQQNTQKQRGAAAIVGIGIIVVILLIAIGFAYVTLTQKQGPVLQVETPKVTADDTLNQGKTNNELVIDRLIIEAALKRDQEQADATDKTLSDSVLPVGDGVTADTTVESTRLSQMQTEYITESDRRLKNLDDALKLTAKLSTDQKTITQKAINDEVTALTGLKAKSAAETTKETFLADRDSLDAEYTDYLMSISQVKLLLWANAQTIFEEKINVLGGKFQERLNDASNSGESIATAQTLVNSYQSNKTTAKDATAKSLKSVNDVKPGTFNANKAVLKSYYDQLNLAHSELNKAAGTSKQIITEIKTYK
jgi:hypothetical protein